MGSREELAELASLMTEHGISPVIDSVYPFEQAAAAFARLESGEASGEIVLDHGRGECPAATAALGPRRRPPTGPSFLLFSGRVRATGALPDC